MSKLNLMLVGERVAIQFTTAEANGGLVTEEHTEKKGVVVATGQLPSDSFVGEGDHVTFVSGVSSYEATVHVDGKATMIMPVENILAVWGE
ncbi:hypothetical protein GR28A_00111 [Vibrio phage vB_VcorM_GR28A]|nr:hypothetical protein GR28A_00111 [Vibrio phage vB_VcorM_GR28A]